jgi:hypothetical protein
MTALSKNQWYVAAYGTQAQRGPLGRTICDEPIVFHRAAGGKVTALADRCVHRRYPLSQSRLVGEHHRPRLPRRMLARMAAEGQAAEGSAMVGRAGQVTVR